VSALPPSCAPFQDGPALSRSAPESGALADAGAASFWDSLQWPDQFGLVLLAVFLMLGTLRGLWWQVIRLAGLLFAGLLARAVAPRFSEGLARHSGLPLLVSQGLLWFAVFVLALLVASLLGTLGKQSLQRMQLGPVDRFGGALAGLVTGLSLQAALLVLLSYLGPQPWTAESLRGTRSEDLLRLVSARLPVFVDSRSAAALELRGWIGGDGQVQAAPAPAGLVPGVEAGPQPWPALPDEPPLEEALDPWPDEGPAPHVR
jgi:uncharacterized membrane protein required for colicin V production